MASPASFRADIAIIGAGMAGASLAAALRGAASVVLVEAEERPGYHATGRSAAFWNETYGGPGVMPLTAASGPFLADGGFLRRRGALHLADGAGFSALADLAAAFAGSAVELRRADRAAIEAAVPGIRAGWDHALVEPSCADIDVAALHAHYLALAARAGVQLLCRAPLGAARRQAGRWRIETGQGSIDAALLVNAAGAWADGVAAIAGARAIGIAPYRRTIVQLRIDPPVPPDLPLVIDAAGRFYFKPEAGGRLWLSPHDETLASAGDAAPEELDVALAIDRLEQVVDWRVAAVERRWAGLRSFTPDRLPVYGFDAHVPGLFWCAGQGGFGIQTAPAAAELAAALLLGRSPAGSAAAIDPARYAPGRFSSAGSATA